MCGFVGYAVTEQTKDERIIRAMADRIRHRGPDDEGYFMDGEMALGFRRLAIIDLEHGKQPLFNEDESIALVFNGEIYNYRELRAELIRAGHTFRTETDSEVLVHGYEEYGRDLLSRLRGMFAFAIWDRRRRKLFGARDMFGIKPFYYYDDGQSFLFGSEIKGFLPHPHFKKELAVSHLLSYLSFEYIPSHETLFRHVYKLLPGHFFEYEKGRFHTEPYHQLLFETDASVPLDQYVDRIAETFRLSVEMHKIADVEVGSFLSGGIDSSYVLHEAARLNPAIRSFSVGYAEERYSELKEATAFAREIGVENIAVKMTAEDFFAAAPKVQYFMDEPLSNPSAVPLYRLAQEAGKHVKVVLSGEGADELFGGYNQYMEALVYEKYQRLPLGLRRLLAKGAEKMPQMKGRRFLIRGARPLHERYFRIDYVFDEEERERVLIDKNLNVSCVPFTKRWFDEAAERGWDQQTQMQYFDLHLWLPYDILLKADRMSMAHSLELRVPFLDREVWEVARRLPTSCRVTGENTKVALRRAAARELPASTASRKKLGFPSPLAEWMRQDTYYNRIREKFVSAAAARFFNRDELMRLLNEHRAGSVSHMQKIWSVYCFLLWYEQYFEQ